MAEAPDIREQGDCAGGEHCDWACDQHEVCARCGKKATGFATVRDMRFCHGDDDPDPTCYMQAQRLLIDAVFMAGPNEMFS